MHAIAIRAAIPAVILGLVFSSISIAQPASAPASAPTSKPVPERRPMIMPPGFHTVTVGNRTAVCESADDKWVKEALQGVPPTTRPATMPADLVTWLHDRRDIFKNHIAGDLAIKDTASIDHLLDDVLLPQVKKLTELRVPVFYLVSTSPRVKELLRGGWSDPRFYYNRAADQVEVSTDMRFYDDRPMDDMLLPMLYDTTATIDRREKDLSQVISRVEGNVNEQFSRRAQVVTQLSIIAFIQKQVIDPLKLKQDQEWLALGIEAVLSTRYMHDLTGVSYDDLLTKMTMQVQQNPVRAETIDLIHPTPRADLRQEWMPYYDDAYRVKAARVVQAWVAKSGDSSIPLTLAAIRAKPPADGAALVKLIEITTGMDLSALVKPN